MNHQGFEDDHHIQFLQTASLVQRRRALIVAVLSALTILLITAGLSVAACSYGFSRIGIALGAIGLIGGIVVGFRIFQSRSSHTQEIAQRADGHWKTTGRFAALWEVYQKPTLLQRKEKFDLISSQLSNVGRSFSVKELLRDTPLFYPVLFTLCALLFFLGALLYRPAQTLSPSQVRRAEMKEELSTLLESAPAMPRIIEKKLESLQASLEDSTLSDEEVIDQIDEVLSDMSAASELYRELEQNRPEQEPATQEPPAQEQEPATEQEEPPTENKEPEEQPQQQEESSSRNSQSQEGKGEDGKQKSQGEGEENREGSSPNESQDQESGNGDAQQAEDEGADGGKQGAGEGEGGQGEQSNGASGSGAGDGNNSEANSSEGNGDSGEGSGEAQGEEPQGEGASSESSSDSTSSEQSSGAQASDSQTSDSSKSNAQAQSLEQATQVLEGMKEQLQSEQGRDGTSNEARDQGQSDTKEGEENKPSDRGNGDSREDSGTNKSSNNAREQDDSSSSDSQESSSEKGDASDIERGSETPNDRSAEQREQLGEQTDDNAAQGASVGEGEPLRREIEGEGEDGFQDGSFGFEDKQLGSLTEKVDSQYAESTGKFSRNEEEASSLREIQEVDLAPPTVRDRPQQQRIPPEYRDILKQR